MEKKGGKLLNYECPNANPLIPPRFVISKKEKKKKREKVPRLTRRGVISNKKKNQK